MLRCLLCEWLRGNFLIILLSLILALATCRTAAGQDNGTINGCTRCPEDQYFDINRGKCLPCTKCLGPLLERLPCANEVPDYCDVLGQFDRLCCEEYEYEAYGCCVLDCRKCEVTGMCKEALLECDCPPDRYGSLCQFSVLPIRPTVALPTTVTVEHPHQPRKKHVFLKAWQNGAILLGTVVSIMGCLCMFGGFWLYCGGKMHLGSPPRPVTVVLQNPSHM